MLPPLLMGVSHVNVTAVWIWSLKFRFRGGLGLSAATAHARIQFVIVQKAANKQQCWVSLTDWIHNLDRVGGSAWPAHAGLVLSTDSEDVLLVLHHVIQRG